MDKLRKEEQRRKYKEDMIYSMKFETDDDYEMYEDSINSLVDPEDVGCIYDLVEGYAGDTDDPDHMNYLDTTIQDLIGVYDDKSYVDTLTKAIVKLKGIADERAEYLVGMITDWDEVEEHYVRVVTELERVAREYHIHVLENIKITSTDKKECQKCVKILEQVTEPIS